MLTPDENEMLTRVGPGPQIGDQAPEFFIDTREGKISLSALAARHQKLIVISQDSYRYHPR